MNAGAKLALYGAGLVVVFGGAYGLAGVAVPDSVVASWTQRAGTETHGGEHGEHGGTEQPASEHPLPGLSLNADGFTLAPVNAPATTGSRGTLSFQILNDHGEPVTEFTTAHEKDLHLIVVRSDGAQFRHAHPVLDTSTGTWSLPWSWQKAGAYRVYADFTPAGTTAAVTLTRTVQVGGAYEPVARGVQSTDEVDGYTVTIGGQLTAGESSRLTISVSRDGRPVTTLQPYLGAFGHLVALRQGDLAYLHVHAEGDAPQPDATAGPEIAFAAHVPTEGRYLLYLDFRVDGQVHTAEFVLDAGH